MTRAPEVPRLRFETLEDAIDAIRARGLRLSTSRRLILEALFAAAGPESAEQIAGRLSMELASVYRNLETFERNGVVRHVHLGHGPGLYVLVGRGEQEYLYCERCGAVTSVSRSELDPARASIEARFGYRARFSHFPIVGVCAKCSASAARDRLATS